MRYTFERGRTGLQSFMPRGAATAAGRGATAAADTAGQGATDTADTADAAARPAAARPAAARPAAARPAAAPTLQQQRQWHLIPSTGLMFFPQLRQQIRGLATRASGSAAATAAQLPATAAQLPVSAATTHDLGVGRTPNAGRYNVLIKDIQEKIQERKNLIVNAQKTGKRHGTIGPLREEIRGLTRQIKNITHGHRVNSHVHLLMIQMRAQKNVKNIQYKPITLPSGLLLENITYAENMVSAVNSSFRQLFTDSTFVTNFTGISTKGSHVDHIFPAIYGVKTCLLSGARETNAEILSKYIRIVAHIYNSGAGGNLMGNLETVTPEENNLFRVFDEVLRTNPTFSFNQAVDTKKGDPKYRTFILNRDFYLVRGHTACKFIIDNFRKSKTEGNADIFHLLDQGIALHQYILDTIYLQRDYSEALGRLRDSSSQAAPDIDTNRVTQLLSIIDMRLSTQLGGMIDFSNYPNTIIDSMTLEYITYLFASLPVNESINNTKDPKKFEDCIEDIKKIWIEFNSNILDKITNKQVNDIMRSIGLVPTIRNDGTVIAEALPPNNNNGNTPAPQGTIGGPSRPQMLPPVSPMVAPGLKGGKTRRYRARRQTRRLRKSRGTMKRKQKKTRRQK